MSAISDWKCGAMSDFEFNEWKKSVNAEEKYYEEHKYDEYDKEDN